MPSFPRGGTSQPPYHPRAGSSSCWMKLILGMQQSLAQRARSPPPGLHSSSTVAACSAPTLRRGPGAAVSVSRCLVCEHSQVRDALWRPLLVVAAIEGGFVDEVMERLRAVDPVYAKPTSRSLQSDKPPPPLPLPPLRTRINIILNEPSSSHAALVTYPRHLNYMYFHVS